MIIEKYFSIDREVAQQLIEATKEMKYEKTGDNAFQNTKVYFFDEYAVLQQDNLNFRNVYTADTDLNHLENIAETLLRLQAQGVNVVPILAFQSDNGNGYIIQPRANGTELYDRDKVRSLDKDYILERVKFLSNAPQEHFDKFVADTIKIMGAGLLIDFVGKDNFFYDEKIGVQFIDLLAHDDEWENGEPSENEIAQWTAHFCFLPCYFDTVPQHGGSVTKILIELTDKERAVLTENNKKIFEKCRNAMINNGISEEIISKAIAGEKFIPQKYQLELI